MGPLGVNSRGGRMTLRFVRSPNNLVLIAAGITFLLLATLAARTAVATANPYRTPMVIRAGGAMTEAILGAALLFVAVRRSQFAGATAVIVATFLAFGIAMKAFISAAFGLAFHLGWVGALDLLIAAAIVGPLLFPWNPNANRPVFFWMGLTFATLTVLFGSLAVLARL